MDKKDKIFEISLVRSLRKHGFILPTEDEDLVYFEKAFQKDETLEFPDSLNLISENIYQHKELKFTILNEIDIAYTENMARAAREGKSIPKEVLDKMKIDRSNSEKNAQ